MRTLAPPCMPTERLCEDAGGMVGAGAQVGAAWAPGAAWGSTGHLSRPSRRSRRFPLGHPCRLGRFGRLDRLGLMGRLAGAARQTHRSPERRTTEPTSPGLRWSTPAEKPKSQPWLRGAMADEVGRRRARAQERPNAMTPTALEEGRADSNGGGACQHFVRPWASTDIAEGSADSENHNLGLWCSDVRWSAICTGALAAAVLPDVQAHGGQHLLDGATGSRLLPALCARLLAVLRPSAGREVHATLLKQAPPRKTTIGWTAILPKNTQIIGQSPWRTRAKSRRSRCRVSRNQTRIQSELAHALSNSSETRAKSGGIALGSVRIRTNPAQAGKLWCQTGPEPIPTERGEISADFFRKSAETSASVWRCRLNLP